MLPLRILLQIPRNKQLPETKQKNIHRRNLEEKDLMLILRIPFSWANYWMVFKTSEMITVYVFSYFYLQKISYEYKKNAVNFHLPLLSFNNYRTVSYIYTLIDFLLSTPSINNNNDNDNHFMGMNKDYS